MCSPLPSHLKILGLYPALRGRGFWSKTQQNKKASFFSCSFLAAEGTAVEFGLRQSPSAAHSHPVPALRPPWGVDPARKSHWPLQKGYFWQDQLLEPKCPGLWSTRACRSHVSRGKGWARTPDANPWLRSLPPTAAFPCDLWGFQEGSLGLTGFSPCLGRGGSPTLTLPQTPPCRAWSPFRALPLHLSRFSSASHSPGLAL